MPLYEFRCQDCQKVSEFQLKLSDPNPSECPSCQGGNLQKLISHTAFSLKGSGWYSDLYSGSSKTKESKPATATAKDPAPASKPASAPSTPPKSTSNKT